MADTSKAAINARYDAIRQMVKDGKITAKEAAKIGNAMSKDYHSKDNSSQRAKDSKPKAKSKPAPKPKAKAKPAPKAKAKPAPKAKAKPTVRKADELGISASERAKRKSASSPAAMNKKPRDSVGMGVFPGMPQAKPQTKKKPTKTNRRGRSY